MLPAAVKAALIAHLERSASNTRPTFATAPAGSSCPNALTRKYPNAGRDWAWQWVFPATRFYVERAHRPASPSPSPRIRRSSAR